MALPCSPPFINSTVLRLMHCLAPKLVPSASGQTDLRTSAPLDYGETQWYEEKLPELVCRSRTWQSHARPINGEREIFREARGAHGPQRSPRKLTLCCPPSKMRRPTETLARLEGMWAEQSDMASTLSRHAMIPTLDSIAPSRRRIPISNSPPATVHAVRPFAEGAGTHRDSGGAEGGN